MPQETERKFLLKDDSWKKMVSSSCFFCQAYIPVLPGEKHTTVRIRIAGEKAFLTLKGSCGKEQKFTRSEFEYPIPLEDAQTMLDEFCGDKIEKTRHIVHIPPFKWEIDEFAGKNAPLNIAEIELPSEETFFPLPPWLGEEVTMDHRYSNSFLAKHPFSTWKDLPFSTGKNSFYGKKESL
ncbi:MAG: CYTH domain-containing protein [Lentisphaeria bacterium]|nr:CYTH domain-containing protein [Lentisphaeria bacterium]